MKNFSICKNPKHLAWATWSILSNNPINKNSYMILVMIEAALAIYYSLILTQRIHVSNLEIGDNDQKMLPSNSSQYDSQSGNDLYIDQMRQKSGLAFLAIRELDQALAGITTPDFGKTWFFINCGLLGVTLVLILSILIMSIFIKSHLDLHKSSYLKKMLCTVFILFQTFLQFPAFEVILRGLMTASSFQDSLGMAILKYLVLSITLILFILLMLYIIRIFNVCVPTPLIPWCYPASKIVFLSLIFKAGLVGCVVVDMEGKYIVYEIIALFFISLIVGAYRLFFSPNYIRDVDMLIKTKDFLITLLLFIGIVCKVVTDQYNYDLIYFICFAPIVTLGWIQFEKNRVQQILLKIKNKTLKLEIEYEYALYQLMMLIELANSESMTTHKVFGQLMDIMIAHIEECDDQLCICDEMEGFYELMRYKFINNSEIFQLDREERKKFKKIIDDQGLIGTISNISDLVIKSTTSESTQLKLNNEFDRLNLDEDAKAIDKHQNKQDQNFPSENKSAKSNMNDTLKPIKKAKKSHKTYKINIDETKFRFLSELIYLFYFEMKNRFPNSLKIQLLSNYFALQYKKKDMLCIFQMRSFIKTKLSTLDQITFITNEMYLLYEIERVQKAQMFLNMEQTDNNINGEYFIKINQLYKSFNISIEALSSSVVNFWKDFEKEQIVVEKTFKTGISIARNILNTFRIFGDLDEIKLFKDYQMYFQFAIVQLHILNDTVAYELYINKMKSILETNKMFEKNYSNEKNSDYSNFIIVNANGNQFGQILQVNNSLRLLLQWNSSDFSKFRIEQFMPTLIRKKHDNFLERYNKTGQSYIINNKTFMFLKKMNGYVIPVELYIKFHYSIDYQYVYLAIVRPIYEMAPFANGVTYNMNQLIFMLTDNEIGEISEYSESSKEILKLYKQSENDEIVKKIGEFIEDFDFKEFTQQRQQRYTTNEILEKTSYIDLNYFSELKGSDKFFNGANLATIQYNMFDAQKVKAKIRIFEERYSGGVLDMNIFCIMIINDSLDASNSDYHSNGSRNMLFQHDEFQMKPLQNMIETIEERDSESSATDGDSQSVNSSISSANSSTTSMAEYRNFHSFTNQTTPRSLKLIVQLVIVLFLIIIIVASVNLGIIILRQKQSELDVHTVKISNDRMNQISMNLLISRVLLNIANGYEPEQSTLVPDRFKLYQDLQRQKIQILRETQSEIQNSNFDKSDKLTELLEGDNIKLYYLNDQNDVFTKTQNLNTAFNLYIARLSDMNSFNQSQLVGKQEFQTLIPNRSHSYKPSNNEQNLFFTVQNGNQGFRRYSIELSRLYGQESESHAEANINQTEITAIISIITIVIVGIIIAPIFTKAEIRKYKALLYFLKIPKDILPQMIQNCEYCLNMNDEERYAQIQKDYEKFLGIKILNQQVEQLKEARDAIHNIRSQTQSGSNSDYNSVSMNMESRGNEQRSINSNTTFNTSKQREQKNSSLNQEPIRNQQAQIKEEQQEENDESKSQNENYNEQKLDEERQLENSHGLRINNLKVKHQSKKVKQQKKEQKEKEDQQPKDLKTLDEIKAKEELEKTEKDYHLTKKKIIKKRAFQRRNSLAFMLISIVIGLSTYFIIAYFLAMKSFQTASDVIRTLELIFYKGSCFDSTMNFMRENEIRPKVFRLEEFENIPAADYYLDFCLKKEQEFTQLKMNMPEYMKGAEELITAMDSEKFCEYQYGEQKILMELCYQANNGILKKGLGNAFYFMYTQILKNNLLINQNVNQKDIEYRKKLLFDPTVIQIIDMKAKLLDQALDNLKETSMQSVITFIKHFYWLWQTQKQHV